MHELIEVEDSRSQLNSAIDQTVSVIASSSDIRRRVGLNSGILGVSEAATRLVQLAIGPGDPLPPPQPKDIVDGVVIDDRFVTNQPIHDQAKIVLEATQPMNIKLLHKEGENSISFI